MIWQFAQAFGSVLKYDSPPAYRNVKPPSPSGTPSATAKASDHHPLERPAGFTCSVLLGAAEDASIMLLFQLRARRAASHEPQAGPATVSKRAKRPQTSTI